MFRLLFRLRMICDIHMTFYCDRNKVIRLNLHHNYKKCILIGTKTCLYLIECKILRDFKTNFKKRPKISLTRENLVIKIVVGNYQLIYDQSKM